MSQGVLAISELSNGKPKKISYEVLSEGRRIADARRCDLSILVLGSGIGNIADEFATYGADKIILADHKDLGEYLTETYCNVSAEIIENEKPSIVIMGASAQGKDLSARLSARLDAPLAMDCIATRIDLDRLVATRPIYGGKILAEVVFEGMPQLITVRPNAMMITPSKGAGAVMVADVNPGESRVKLTGKQMETGRVELTEADIVVSGGRGMGDSDYSIIENLAQALDGAVGASRASVDEGWRPVSDQVGQTGKVVSPNLYVACGISGAIQHLAGMQTSRVIVAINKDGDAPIFSKADYGIVGDLFSIVPMITEEVKKIKN